jgi:flagellar FliL protein
MAEAKAAAKPADKAAEKPADKAPEATATPEATPAKKGRGKTLIIIAVAGVLVLGGGGLAAYHFLKPPAEGAAAGGKEAAKEETAGTGIVSFEPFIANLADTGGRRYARVSVRVIVGDEAEAKEIQENQVTLMRLRASILELLTTQTAEHIVTPDGRSELRKAIAEHADGIVKPVKVSDVLFADFVVQ